VNRSVVLPLLAGLASVALLSACAVDQGAVAQSSDQVPSIQGVGAAAGHVTVDNALVVFPPQLKYPAGADAPLSLVITNGALTDDRLVSAQSTIARAVEITPPSPGTTPPPLGCVRSPYPPAPPAEPVTPTSTSVARPLPNGGTVIMTPNCPHLLLAGLTRQLTLLDTVTLRLTFANAGTVALVLPVQTSNHPLPREAVPGVDNPTPGIPTPDSRG
jgi:copper(I)-binding protein